MEQRYLVVTFDGFRRMGQRFFQLLLFRLGRWVAATQDGSCFDMMRLKGDDAEIASFSSPSPSLPPPLHPFVRPPPHGSSQLPPEPILCLLLGLLQKLKKLIVPEERITIYLGMIVLLSVDLFL